MRSMLKSALGALMVALVLSAIASASAYASPEWAVCASPPTGWSHGVRYETKGECEKEEHSGTKGEWEWGPPNEAVTMTGQGKQTFSISKGLLVIECSELKGNAYYEHGVKSELDGLVYTGCRDPSPGCGYIASPGQPNGTIALALELPAKLVTREGVTYEEIEQNSAGEIVTLDMEVTEGKGGCGPFTSIKKLKGSMLAKVNTAAQELEFTGKSGEKQLEMNTIDVEYSGNVKQEAKGGGDLKLLEENYLALPPEWEYNEGVKWKGLGTGESRNIVLKQDGSQVFTSYHEGGAIACEAMEGKGKIKAEGKGEEVTRTYTGCKVTHPTECGYVASPGEPNGTIALASELPAKLLVKEGVTYDEIEQNASKGEIGSFKIEKSPGDEKPCGIFKLNNKFKGSLLAKVNNLVQEFDFEGKSGTKPFEINTLEGCEYNGKDHVELEGGGKIRAS
jgi:hypothetical protein